MSCKDEAEAQARVLAQVTRVAFGQAEGRERCKNPKCNLPLNNQGKCPRGCAQTVSARSVLAQVDQWYGELSGKELAAAEKACGQWFPRDALKSDDAEQALTTIAQWYERVGLHPEAAAKLRAAERQATDGPSERPFPRDEIYRVLAQGMPVEVVIPQGFVLVGSEGELLSAKAFADAATASTAALRAMDLTGSVVMVVGAEKVGGASPRPPQLPLDMPPAPARPPLNTAERVLLRQALLELGTTLRQKPLPAAGPALYEVAVYQEERGEPSARYQVDVAAGTCTCGGGGAEARCSHLLVATHLHGQNVGWDLARVTAWRDAALADGWAARPTYTTVSGGVGESAERACTLTRDGFTVQVVTRPAGKDRQGYATPVDASIAAWGPDGLAIELDSPTYSMTALQRSLTRCGYCEAEGPTTRLGFAGRACPECRTVLAPKIEHRGWAD